MTLKPDLKHERIVFAESLQGAEIGKILTLCSFCLIVYEYMITLDDELTYFWNGRWTPSRVLFFLNRYIPPVMIFLNVIGYVIVDPSPTFCDRGIHAIFFLNTFAIGVIQGILTARVWYLFQGGRTIQICVICGFLASIICSFSLLYISGNTITIILAEDLNILFPNFRNVGCKATRPDDYWRTFVPSLILHTILYFLTAVRAIRNRRLLKESPVLKRLLRDGGFFYFVVFVSVGLTAICSFISKSPKINIPAIYSPFLLTTTSIAVTRILFSIHSLAEKLGSDSAWLLTHVQLSRVGWRRGAHEGEIIVERDTTYDDDDLESKDSYPMKAGSVRSLVTTTRIGVHDEPWYGRPL